jgi:hypothetical protein
MFRMSKQGNGDDIQADWKSLGNTTKAISKAISSSSWIANRLPPNRPRYGITFDDHVTPEERALGLASSTIKVIDLQTQAVLGEATQYAWTPGVLFTGPKGPNAKDRWLSAYGCGHPHQETGFLTRLFVDQVLKPLSPHRK